MAKRKAAAPRRKAARKPTRKAVRRASKPAAKRTARKAVRAARPAPKRAKSAPKKTARVAKTAAPKARPKSSAPIRPKPAALSRERRQWREEDMVPMPPSTLNFNQKATSAETGQNHYHQKKRDHTEGGQDITGGDLDADWNDAYSSGEEAPGGDMPTPDQDVVEEIGRALGVEYEDAEEL